MKEIERIIKEQDTWESKEEGVALVIPQDLAKAIEQYIIKARIEELDMINTCDIERQTIKRIAQLKKGLE